MMKIETQEIGESLTLKVEGRLAGAGVSTLEDCWRAGVARHPHGKFTVDLTSVTFIDKAGSLLLQLMHRDGSAFKTSGRMTEELEEILRRNK
jgi:anti-anti-sigma regulatory factor